MHAERKENYFFFFSFLPITSFSDQNIQTKTERINHNKTITEMEKSFPKPSYKMKTEIEKAQR